MKKALSFFALVMAAVAVIGLSGCVPDTYTVTGEFYQRADDARDTDFYLGSIELQEMNQEIDPAGADYIVWDIKATSGGNETAFDWEIGITTDQTQAPRLFEHGRNSTEVKMNLRDFSGSFGIIFDAKAGIQNADGVTLPLWKGQKSAWILGNTAADKCTLTTTVEGEGTVTGAGTYDRGETVPVTATPASGWTFDHWTVNGVLGVTNPVAQVEMNSETVAVKAIFKAVQTTSKCVLTTSVVGQGTVTGAGSYDRGTTVTVTATPASGWTFVKWTVNGSDGKSTLSATVDMDSDVVAVVGVFTQSGTTGDTTAPVITLNGSAQVNLTVGQAWTDPGATATDNVDGSVVVTVTGTVNTATVGNYSLTYSAHDVAGNYAVPVTRSVNVSNGSTPPTSPKMLYGLVQNGSLRQEFVQDGVTLQQAWIGFPVGKTWSDVATMGSMFMVGNNPLLYLESGVNGWNEVYLTDPRLVLGWSARAVPFITLKGSVTRYFGNTGIVAGYELQNKMTRSDGDNYDMVLSAYIKG